MDDKTIEFVNKAKKIHGDKYEYTKVKYIHSKQKVIITCPIHGDFEQTPNKHLNGQGCKECGIKSRSVKNSLTRKEFIDKAKEIHGDKYDYSKSNYINNRTKILIECGLHGGFYQSPQSHLQGQGCPCCGIESRVAKSTTPLSEFKERASNTHNNKYDYSKVSYSKLSDKVCIICPEHGEFWQAGINHLSGQGCPECGKISTYNSLFIGYSNFLQRASEIHNSKYEYDKDSYISTKEKMKIKCPEHSWFEMTPHNHLQGQGCPKCGRISAGNKLRNTTEEIIKRAIEAHGDKYTYEKTEYKTYYDKIIVTCKVHGDFEILPSSLTNGFGCPKCTLKSQHKIYEIICNRFPNIRFEWETSPKWLGIQRFDIYSPEYNFAIEYNGIQHYQPIEYFGGEDRFKKQQFDDAKKLKLCEENNCKMFIIKYNYTEKDLEDLFNGIKQIIDYEIS